jgi:DNA-binding MarR family transcriptional regulator
VITAQVSNRTPQKGTLNKLQAVAADYAAHGLTVIPALPRTKEAALNWKTFQVDAPSERERNAMFSEPGLNIAFVCGAVSGNVMQIDCETPRAFERQYALVNRAGLSDTWIDLSPSGGGHFSFRLPFPVKTRGKVEDVEILSEGRISLLPPSIAVSKTDGTLRPYETANRPAEILTVDSVDQLHWLNLERASLQTQFRAFPRKAQRMLEGEWDRRCYASRSEVDQAIIASLVNAGFSWESILAAFRRYPAAGKFSSIYHADSHAGLEWLRVSWNEARDFCANTSPARKNALDLFNHAQSIPWRGRTGSTQRACFAAHCGLSYRSGHRIYHASVRDVAEFAGIDKSTASTATARLCAAGALKLTQRAAYTFASKYELPLYSNLITKPENTRSCGHSINPICVGVSAVSSFLTPEAFRRKGLGLSCLEVLHALSAGPLSAPQIADKTGRHVQTVRTALKELKEHGLVAKTGKYWRGRSLEDIDLDDLARTVSVKGAALAQKERHSADRIRHKLRRRIRQQTQQDGQNERGDA